MAEEIGKPLKFTITHYRRAQHSHEDFIKWIVEGHLPLAIPIFKKHGVLGYTLFVTPPPFNSAMKEDLGRFRPAWEFADFDCFIEYTMPNVQAIKDVMADPDWPAAVKDEEHWVDGSKALASLGYATPYLLATGEVVNMAK